MQAASFNMCKAAIRNATESVKGKEKESENKRDNDIVAGKKREEKKSERKKERKKENTLKEK